ncbi:GDNF family receptor alpha-like [Varanus komodoensis]|nr:GDNF family receptor alpha-like [Varanus komodoensis]
MRPVLLLTEYIVCFAVLGIHSMAASTLQTEIAKCQQLREKCVLEKKGCESVWNLLEEACNIPGNRCTVKESMNCNKIIQFLVEQFPEFKDCICTKDNCSIKMLFGKECFSTKAKSAPPSSSDIQSKFPQQTKGQETAHMGGPGNDCSLAKEICQGDEACSVRYKKFQRVCRAEVAKCSLQRVVQQCFTAWKELMQTVLANCSCPEPVHKRCTKIWKNIFNNTCLQHIQEYQLPDISKDIYAGEGTQGHNADHMKIKSQWKLSALSDYEYKHRRSCFQVNVQCVDDTVCNRQLSRYLQACQVNGTHCNVNRCQAALQVFYENMPFNVAQMLAFCDCMEADESCHKAKGVLHGTPCAVRMVPPPSCLHVIHTCQTNSLCWGKYKTFTSKCLMQISQPCLEDKACLESLDTNSLVCSDSAECRAAYVGMRGSLLQVECTCETTSAAQESMCRQFQHILHSNSCFSRLRTSAHLLFIYCPTSWRFQVGGQIAGKKADLYSSHRDLSGKILPATGEQSLIYDDTITMIIYVICIILILGIILLAVLKTRACTNAYQAKTASTAHLSEKLMMPHQPWITNHDNNAP